MNFYTRMIGLTIYECVLPFNYCHLKIFNTFIALLISCLQRSKYILSYLLLSIVFAEDMLYHVRFPNIYFTCYLILSSTIYRSLVAQKTRVTNFDDKTVMALFLVLFCEIMGFNGLFY